MHREGGRLRLGLNREPALWGGATLVPPREGADPERLAGRLAAAFAAGPLASAAGHLRRWRELSAGERSHSTVALLESAFFAASYQDDPRAAPGYLDRAPATPPELQGLRCRAEAAVAIVEGDVPRAERLVADARRLAGETAPIFEARHLDRLAEQLAARPVCA